MATQAEMPPLVGMTVEVVGVRSRAHGPSRTTTANGRASVNKDAEAPCQPASSGLRPFSLALERQAARL